VRWTQQAAADLEAITRLVAEESPNRTGIFALDVLSAVDRIAAG